MLGSRAKINRIVYVHGRIQLSTKVIGTATVQPYYKGR